MGISVHFTPDTENEIQHNKFDSGGSWYRLSKKGKAPTMTGNARNEEK